MLKSPPKRRMPAERRALHHDVAGALDQPLCEDVGHKCIRVVRRRLRPLGLDAQRRVGVERGFELGFAGSYLQTLPSLGETCCGILALSDETFLRVGFPACRVSLRDRPRGPSSLVRPAEALPFPASFLRNFPSRSRSLRPDLDGSMKSNSTAFAWPRASIMAVRNS